MVEIVSGVCFGIKKSRTNAQFDHERQEKRAYLNMLEEYYKSEEDELLLLTAQINVFKEKRYMRV